MRLVFFGTPDFAVPSLRALLGEGFEVAAVVTRPDRPVGRSRSAVHAPPVKQAALEDGLPILQPENPNAPEFLEQLRPFAPDLGVVVAYGHILGEPLLHLPGRGMVNVHASLLPAFRGAAPIQHALIEGAEQTGISVMKMDAGMDTGPVLLRVPTPVATDETGGELEVRLAELGALALVEALALWSAGALVPETQDEEHATYAPKISRAMARIRWEEPAERIARLTRALDPRPGAWSELRGRHVKLFGPKPAGFPTRRTPAGEVLEIEPAFVVSTGEGALQFVDVQPEGKSRMAARDWGRGRGVAPGDRFQ